MLKTAIIIACMFVPLSLTGCFSHQHTIDSGYHIGKEKEYHQWYLLWGFVPIGEDKNAGALSPNDKLRIKSKFNWLDIVMNITLPGLMGLGVTRRTVVIQE